MMKFAKLGYGEGAYEGRRGLSGQRKLLKSHPWPIARRPPSKDNEQNWESPAEVSSSAVVFDANDDHYNHFDLAHDDLDDHDDHDDHDDYDDYDDKSCDIDNGD